MSIKLNLAAAALALAAASLSCQASAAPGPICNGQWQRTVSGMLQCYYLPTVSDGRVTGLQLHGNVHHWSGVVVPPGRSRAR
jgi:hypothetical protein